MGIQLSCVKKLDIKGGCKNVKCHYIFYLGKQVSVMQILFILIHNGFTLVFK